MSTRIVVLRKVGDSLVLTIPKDVANKSGLHERDKMILAVPATGQVLVVREAQEEA